MPTISMFRGLKVFINWDDHNQPHLENWALAAQQKELFPIEPLR